MKKSNLVAIAAVALGLTGAGVGVIHAQSATTSGSNPMSNLVTAIATKFNLNTADVQQVFDDQRAQMEATREQEYKNRLAQLVTDGKLTQEQADKITGKLAELKVQREANKTAFEGKTEEERHAAMKTEMEALKQWATDNSIPLQYLKFGFGHGPHGGMRGGHGFEKPVDPIITN